MMMLGELSKMVVKMLNWNLFVERGNGKHGWVIMRLSWIKLGPTLSNKRIYFWYCIYNAKTNAIY
jgi:hypothetical protein